MFESIDDEDIIKMEPCEEDIENNPIENTKITAENIRDNNNLYEICKIKVEPDIIKQITSNNSLPFYGNIEVKIEHEVHESDDLVSSIVNLNSRDKIIFEDSLYNNHTIKEELVLGPEIVQESNNFGPHELNDFNDNKTLTCSKDNHDIQLECGSCKDKFICEHCKKKFIGKGKIIRHLKTNHIEIFLKRKYFTINSKKFLCDKCEKCYVKKETLIRHIMIVHEGKKPFPCNKCRNSYTGKLELQYHYLKFHSSLDISNENKKLTPFTYCQYCDRPFTRKSHCNIHEKYQCIKNKNRKKVCKTKITVPKKYCCDFCDKEYAYKSTLNQHVKIHLGTKNMYQCDICDKKYTKKANLKNHILSKHMNLRIYSCDQCELTFTSLWAVTCHKQKRCPRKFECSICRTHLKDRNGLNKHIRKHHTNSMYHSNI